MREYIKLSLYASHVRQLTIYVNNNIIIIQQNNFLNQYFFSYQKFF